MKSRWHLNGSSIRVIHKICECTLVALGFFSYCFKTPLKWLALQEGTMHIVWARGNVTDGYTRADNYAHGGGHHKHSIGKDSGIFVMRLLRPDRIKIPEKFEFFESKLEIRFNSLFIDRNIKEVIITADNVEVPAKKTTYWCHIQKLDDFISTKHHIIEVVYRRFVD